MEEYNIGKLKDSAQDSEIVSNTEEKKPNYSKALGYGFLASLGVAFLMAILAIAIGAEYVIVLIIGAGCVAYVIHSNVPHKSIGGAIIGAILCSITYFLYLFFIDAFGYYFEDGVDLGITLIVSIAFGAWLGYNND